MLGGTDLCQVKRFHTGVDDHRPVLQRNGSGADVDQFHDVWSEEVQRVAAVHILARLVGAGPLALVRGREVEREETVRIGFLRLAVLVFVAQKIIAAFVLVFLLDGMNAGNAVHVQFSQIRTLESAPVVLESLVCAVDEIVEFLLFRSVRPGVESAGHFLAVGPDRGGSEPGRPDRYPVIGGVGLDAFQESFPVAANLDSHAFVVASRTADDLKTFCNGASGAGDMVDYAGGVFPLVLEPAAYFSFHESGVVSARKHRIFQPDLGLAPRCLDILDTPVSSHAAGRIRTLVVVPLPGIDAVGEHHVVAVLVLPAVALVVRFHDPAAVVRHDLVEAYRLDAVRTFDRRKHMVLVGVVRHVDDEFTQSC